MEAKKSGASVHDDSAFLVFLLGSFLTPNTQHPTPNI
jgi:hypothetical protein